MHVALEEKNKAVENQPVTPVVCIRNYFHLLGKRRNYVEGVRPTGQRLLLQIECVPKWFLRSYLLKNMSLLLV